MTSHTNMKNLPESERPYEKFIHSGPSSLTDAELVAVIIKSGTSGRTAMEVARDLLTYRHQNLLNLYEYSFDELCDFKGIGRVKAIQLKCIAELSVRIARTQRGYHIQMSTPATVAEYYMEQMRHRKEEALWAAFFDAKCNFLGDSEISVGSVNYAYVSPRDVFRKALECNAVFLILLHNHPSGDPTPSEDDRHVTRRIISCGELLGVELADHIIIGDNCYFSFKEEHII